MAIDEALLAAVVNGSSLPVLRLYRWRPAAVSLGYAQRGAEVVNLAACGDLGYDVVRRCTGGRAVLHDQEMTYAVISPNRSSIFPGGILNNYQVVAHVLQQTLAGFGLQAQLVRERSRGLAGCGAEKSACFTAPGQFELVHHGFKLAGCAQKRLGDGFLQHGSVPLVIDTLKLFLALNTRPELDPATGAGLLDKQVGWINRWLDQPVAVSQLEESFIRWFSQLCRIHFLEDQLTTAEQQHAAQLLEQRYANPAWNLQGLC